MTGKVDRDGFPMNPDKPRFEFVGGDDEGSDIGAQMDITGASDVSIQVRADGKVIWVNVDGVCKLRVCRIDRLVVEDNRPEGGDITGDARDTE